MANSGKDMLLQRGEDIVREIEEGLSKPPSVTRVFNQGTMFKNWQSLVIDAGVAGEAKDIVEKGQKLIQKAWANLKAA